MASKDKRPFTFFQAVKCAFSGIVYALKTERNMRVHFFAALIVVLAGLYFSVTVFEWLILILAVAITIVLELINTAIEKVVDLVTAEQHPLAKAAKDIAAGAVLIFCLASVMIGLFIFVPYIIERFIL